MSVHPWQKGRSSATTATVASLALEDWSLWYCSTSSFLQYIITRAISNLRSFIIARLEHLVLSLCGFQLLSVDPPKDTKCNQNCGILARCFEREIRSTRTPICAMTSASVVTLNVGGQLFTTSLQTLTSNPNSYFARRTAGDFPAHIMPDGSHFIDRSPQHFQKVLDFLRNGYCILPTQVEQRLELHIEADFYCLEQLKTFISGEAMCMYNNIMQHALVLAIDPEMHSAIMQLKHLAYGTSPGASALTQPATVDVQLTSAPHNAFDANCKAGTQELSWTCLGSAQNIFFARALFISGDFTTSRKYQIAHSNDSRVSPLDGKRIEAVAPAGCRSALHSCKVLPFTSVEQQLLKLVAYLQTHKDDVLLHLQKFETYQAVTLHHSRKEAQPMVGAREFFKFTFQL